jgi:hypothetical protein
MRESLLGAFLEGTADGASLADGLADVIGRRGLVPGQNLTEDLEEPFPVNSAHLVRLCDAHIAGDIDSDDLKAAAQFLRAAQHFTWSNASPDGELVAQILCEWSAPESHYPLTGSNVLRYRTGLVDGKHAFRR